MFLINFSLLGRKRYRSDRLQLQIRYSDGLKYFPTRCWQTPQHGQIVRRSLDTFKSCYLLFLNPAKFAYQDLFLYKELMLTVKVPIVFRCNWRVKFSRCIDSATITARPNTGWKTKWDVNDLCSHNVIKTEIISSHCTDVDVNGLCCKTQNSDE